MEGAYNGTSKLFYITNKKITTTSRKARSTGSRKINPRKEEIFGPYTNVKGMKKTLSVINKLYKIRNCNLILNKNNIEKKKFKVCLEYHIGNCKGPCAGHQTEKNYLQDIQEIKSILLGR